MSAVTLTADEAAAVCEIADKTTWNLADGAHYGADAALMLTHATQLTRAASLIVAARGGELPADRVEEVRGVLPDMLRDIAGSIASVYPEYRDQYEAIMRGLVSLTTKLEAVPA